MWRAGRGGSSFPSIGPALATPWWGPPALHCGARRGVREATAVTPRGLESAGRVSVLAPPCAALRRVGMVGPARPRRGRSLGRRRRVARVARRDVSRKQPQPHRNDHSLTPRIEEEAERKRKGEGVKGVVSLHEEKQNRNFHKR